MYLRFVYGYNFIFGNTPFHNSPDQGLSKYRVFPLEKHFPQVQIQVREVWQIQIRILSSSNKYYGLYFKNSRIWLERRIRRCQFTSKSKAENIGRFLVDFSKIQNKTSKELRIHSYFNCLRSKNSRLTYFIIKVTNPVINIMPIMPIINAGTDRSTFRWFSGFLSAFLLLF